MPTQKTAIVSQIPVKIKKRDGRVLDFDTKRITDAIFKAFEASGQPNRRLAEAATIAVLEKLEKKYKQNITKAIPPIEEIQDFVEESLIEKGFVKAAKSYILYRQKRAEMRREKQEILDKEEIDEVDKRFDPNALRVLRSRYLRKDDTGKVIESPKELFLRVAIHAALPDILYDKRVIRVKTANGNGPFVDKEPSAGRQIENLANDKASALVGSLRIGDHFLNIFHIKGLYYTFKRFEQEKRTKIDWDALVKMLKQNLFKEHQKTVDEFYSMMVSRKFMPNTPVVANFGNYLGMGSACFALDIDDSLDSIMSTLEKASVVFKSGGGMGYNFSKLRPEGDFIKTTGGVSSGPITFMRLFDTMTEVVKQGGIRRGANMGIMNSNHPDIEKFIVAKAGNKVLKNFNISILMMPDFWECYKKDKPYPLVNPRTKIIQKYISARLLFEQIVYQAWESAEPGVIFFDRINEHNPFLKSLGPIVTTNPCGEVLLYPNESCNLGSINLWAFVKKDAREKKTLDWEELGRVVRVAAHFLDNVIDINKLPLIEIEEMTLKTRKIGLGVMGLADLLFEIGVPFNSQKGREVMEKIMESVNYHSKIESIEIAKIRGAFSYFKKSSYAEGEMPFVGFYEKKSWSFDWKTVAENIKKYGLRNSYTTVIAPTGSISMIAGCSSGIEPVYSLVFQKNVAVGSFYYINPVFEREMLRVGLFDEALVTNVVNQRGSIQHINYMPPQVKKVFVTSHDISPEDHIKGMASFQKWVDSSISKTINFPREATVEEMKKAYLLAYELGCKDATVYRDTSIKDQVLITIEDKKSSKTGGGESLTSLKDEKAEGLAVYHKPSADYANDNGNGNGAEHHGNGNDNGITKPTHCPTCKIKLTFQEGCVSCSICGWGLCV